MPVPYGWLFAIFGTFSGLPLEVAEWFDLSPWFGASAVWSPSFPSTYAWAVFSGGVAGMVESFETPASYWPDNLW